MLFARVVLGLPLDGPFDYIVPPELESSIKTGCRVAVDFGYRKMTGYVVGLSHKSSIKKLKEISKLIDLSPLLDGRMLECAKQLSEYYCCSWGEAIESVLPLSLRKGRAASTALAAPGQSSENTQITLLHDEGGLSRWPVYLERIRQALENNRSVLILQPDAEALERAGKFIHDELNITPVLLMRKQAHEAQEWEKVRSGLVQVVMGMRSGIFAPLMDLGLIIIDDEENSVYKQEQVPHYHAREVGFMRAEIEKCSLLLGSTSPSLESMYLVEENKIQYEHLPRRRGFPEVKIIDTKRLPFAAKGKEPVFSKYLEDNIYTALNEKGRVLLFLNRLGFATASICQNCKTPIKCPRCSINLVYHFHEELLRCHYCNYKMALPKICPHCNSGYMKFSGVGTEKVENELSRIFPQARVKSLEQSGVEGAKDADIFVATSAVLKHRELTFDLVGVLGLDNSLNRVDLRASEKVFASLTGLSGLSSKKMIVQTALPNHHCFTALLKKDIKAFYADEFKQRKLLHFPPYKHLAFIKLRGKIEEKVKSASESLYALLQKETKIRSVKFISLTPSQPYKLRGNFCWQILASCSKPQVLCREVKIHFRDMPRSGIIVTVDVDPL